MIILSFCFKSGGRRRRLVAVDFELSVLFDGPHVSYRHHLTYRLANVLGDH